MSTNQQRLSSRQKSSETVRGRRLLEQTQQLPVRDHQGTQALMVKGVLDGKINLDRVDLCPKNRSQVKSSGFREWKAPLAGCYYSNGSMLARVIATDDKSVLVQYPSIGAPRKAHIKLNAFIQYLAANDMRIFRMNGTEVLLASTIFIEEQKTTSAEVVH